MADTTKPIAPIVTATLTQRVVLRWKGASDNVGVSRYEVWDGPIFLRTLVSTTREYTTPPLSSGEHKLRVVVYDAAGNYANSLDAIVIVPVAERVPEVVETPPPVVTSPPSSSFKFNNLIFVDHFDTLDTTKWSLYNGEGHAFNGLRKPSQWAVRGDVPNVNGGCLVGTTDWVDIPTALSLIPAGLQQWKKDKLVNIINASNGAILTPGMSCRKTGVLYGRFEVRMRTEVDETGITASNFLTWPDDQDWPAHGEMNIWETTGIGNAARNPMMSYIHYGSDNRQKPFEHAVSGADWHTIIAEWTPDYIKIWRDGVLVWTMTDKIAIPLWPHHPCLQLDGLRNANPRKAIRVFYDYVKIYQ
jgi:hypothetical protein